MKRILLVIVILIGIVLISGFFIKKDMHAEREIVINRSKDDVFSYVKMLKNQNTYSKWSKMDPAMKTSFRGEDGTVGFVSVWESEKDDVGAGEQEIKKISDGQRLDYELRFKKPFESTATAYMVTEIVGEQQTKVRWGFDGNMSYPFNILRLFMDSEKMVGDDFETGLKTLKANLESQKNPSAMVQ